MTAGYPRRAGEVGVVEAGYGYDDVRRYGAKGDGRTNDRAAFENALASASSTAGGVVEVPAGNYRVSFPAPAGYLAMSANSTLRIREGARVFCDTAADLSYRPFIRMAAGSAIIGESAASCTIECTARRTAINVSSSGIVLNVRVRGDGGRSGRPVQGINSGGSGYADSPKGAFIESCTIENWYGHGINTGVYSERFRILNNVVQNNYMDGVLLGGGTRDCLVEGNACRANGSQGIDVNGPRNTIRLNTVAACGFNYTGYDYWGILLQAIFGGGVAFVVTDCLVEQNRVSDCHGQGIALRPHINGAYCRRCTVVGNIVERNGLRTRAGGITIDWGAPYAADHSDHLIAENTCSGNGSHGIVINGGQWRGTRADRITIRGNTCVGNKGRGILIDGSVSVVSDTLIADNVSRDNAGGDAIGTGSGTRRTRLVGNTGSDR